MEKKNIPAERRRILKEEVAAGEELKKGKRPQKLGEELKVRK